MYLMIGTLPDLAFAVGKLAQFCENRILAHWNAIKRILMYIKGTVNLGLCFSGSNDIGLHGCGASHWPGDVRD